MKRKKKQLSYLQRLIDLAKLEKENVLNYIENYPEIKIDYEYRFKTILNHINELPIYPEYDTNTQILIDTAGLGYFNVSSSINLGNKTSPKSPNIKNNLINSGQMNPLSLSPSTQGNLTTKIDKKEF
mmetsp:Transcript_11349/g.10013  ORF Transcript_11349/g.10013 Transcript_11349/m.10013 type:complete len:127 (-) Transcript_11349:1052-1432(-)